MIFRSLKLAMCASATAMSLGAVGHAYAQATGLEEVVVTAERRSTDVQRTPLAIQAIAGDSLTSQSINTADDLQRIVPSLNTVHNSAYANIYINGVGGGVSNLYGTPTVAYNLDGVALGQAYGASTAYYDLERVEVLKGPQGTLYGRNATGGAINIIPNTPKDYFEGAIGITGGNYNDLEVNGMINTPLTDTLAARVAFSSQRHDGYLTNGTQDADNYALRGNLQWKPSDDLTLRLTADYTNIGGVGSGEVPLYPGRSLTGRPPPLPGFTGKFLNPSNKWTAFTAANTYPTCTNPVRCLIGAAGASPGNTSPINANIPARLPLSAGADQFQDITQLQIAGHMDWNLGFGTLTVIPAYVRTDVEYVNYNNLRRGYTKQNSEQYSAEARIASNGQGPLKWVVGAFYYNQDLSAVNLFFQEDNGYLGYNVPHLKDTSYAVFGQATYSLTETFRLTGGLRWTRETGDQDGFAPSPPVTTPNFIAANPTVGYRDGNIASRGSSEDSATTYLARAEWDVLPQSMIFASASSGFKAGGFNPGTSANTFPPEKITAYEVGAKNRFLDNRLQVNLDGFYWDYRNQQVQQNYGVQPCPNVCFAFSVVPVKQTHVWGVEADIKYLLTDNTKLGLDIVRQRGVFDHYSTLAVPILNSPALTYDGNDRPWTPHWKVDASIEQTFPLGEGDLVLFFHTHWQAKQNLVNNINPLQPRDLVVAKAFSMSDASISYRRDRWSVAAFVNNIENTFTCQNGNVTASMFGGSSCSPLPPRTYGVRLNAKFGAPPEAAPPPPPASAGGQ